MEQLGHYGWENPGGWRAGAMVSHDPKYDDARHTMDDYDHMI